MTQEEKAYNEAIYNNYKSFNELVERLESVKSAIKEHNYGIAMDTLYKPYPEFQITTSTKLKESDEMIRDEIVIYIGAKDDISLNTHNRWLSWLEKQGEQKSAEWSKEDIEMLNSAISFVEHSAFTTIGKGKNNVISWLKSLKERYTWKPTKEQIYMLEWLTNNVLDDGLVGKKAKEVLYSLCEQLENL